VRKTTNIFVIFGIRYFDLILQATADTAILGLALQMKYQFQVPMYIAQKIR
jgi:hypothetical protein